MPNGKYLNPRLTEYHRDKISTTQIINRLQKHILGELKMSPSQVAAANVLLRKVLPDLKACELSGGVDVQVTGITEQLILPGQPFTLPTVPARNREPVNPEHDEQDEQPELTLTVAVKRGRGRPRKDEAAPVVPKKKKPGRPKKKKLKSK